MDDLSFAGHTDYGLADLLRSRIRERDQADGKNSVLHAALVHEVARVERELAIRNAREQARLDAEAAADMRLSLETQVTALRTGSIIDLTVSPESEIRTLREENARLMRLTDPSEIGAAVIRAIVDQQDHGLGRVALGVMTAIADSVAAMLSGEHRAAVAKAERDKARLDAEAGSLQPSDAQVSGLLDEVQRLRSMEAELRALAGQWISVGVMPDESPVAALVARAAALETEVARLTKLLEHAEMAGEARADAAMLEAAGYSRGSVFPSRPLDVERIKTVVAEQIKRYLEIDCSRDERGWISLRSDSFDRIAGNIAARSTDKLAGMAIAQPSALAPGDIPSDVLESLIPDPVDAGPDPSVSRIAGIVSLSVLVARRHLVALVLEVQRRRRAPEPLDVTFLRRVTSRTKHGPHESGESGPCDVDCLKCEAERRIACAPEAMADVTLTADEIRAIANWRPDAIYDRLDHQPAMDAIDRLLAAHGAKP